jgi:hypothetical protein
LPLRYVPDGHRIAAAVATSPPELIVELSPQALTCQIAAVVSKAMTARRMGQSPGYARRLSS